MIGHIPLGEDDQYEAFYLGGMLLKFGLKNSKYFSQASTVYPMGMAEKIFSLLSTQSLKPGFSGNKIDS